MLCNVLEKPDGSIAISHPNEKLRFWLIDGIMQPLPTEEYRKLRADLFISDSVEDLTTRDENIHAELLVRYVTGESDDAFADRINQRLIDEGKVKDGAVRKGKINRRDAICCTMRKEARKWNGTTKALEDNHDITCCCEATAAVKWKQEEEINTPSGDSKGRKLTAGRPDMLTDTERDEIVTEWRASNSSPPESTFTPPESRKVIPEVKKIAPDE